MMEQLLEHAFGYWRAVESGIDTDIAATQLQLRTDADGVHQLRQQLNSAWQDEVRASQLPLNPTVFVWSPCHSPCVGKTTPEQQCSEYCPCTDRKIVRELSDLLGVLGHLPTCIGRQPTGANYSRDGMGCITL